MFDRDTRVDAQSFYKDKDATLDDLREAVTTFTETERPARRVLGGQHPTTKGIEGHLMVARRVRDARESGREVIFE